MSGRFNDSTNSNYTQQQDVQANALSKFGNDRNNVIANGQTGQTYNPQTGAVSGQALDAGTQQQTYAPAQAGGDIWAKDRAGNVVILHKDGSVSPVDVVQPATTSPVTAPVESYNSFGQNQQAQAQGENPNRLGRHHRSVAQGESYNLSGQNPQAVAQGENYNLSGQNPQGAAYDRNGNPIGVTAQGDMQQGQLPVYNGHHHPRQTHLDKARGVWIDDRTGQVVGVEGQEPERNGGGGIGGFLRGVAQGFESRGMGMGIGMGGLGGYGGYGGYGYGGLGGLFHPGRYTYPRNYGYGMPGYGYGGGIMGAPMMNRPIIGAPGYGNAGNQPCESGSEAAGRIAGEAGKVGTEVGLMFLANKIMNSGRGYGGGYGYGGGFRSLFMGF